MRIEPAARALSLLTLELWPGLRRGIAVQPLLSIALFLCIGSGLVLQPEPVWAVVFYLGVVPLTLRELWRRHVFDWRNGGTWLALALIAWSMLTLAWGEDSGGRSVKFLWGSLCTAVFFAALLLVLEGDPRNERRIATILIVAGAGNAAFSIVHWLLAMQSARLTGWGVTKHEILGASVIGVCYAFALGRCIAERPYRALNGVAAALCFSFVVLTQSRTPIAATVAVTLVLGVASQRPVRAFALAAAAIGLAAGAVLLLAPDQSRDYITAALARGDSHRLEIWSRTLAEIAERPWLGHGLAANLTQSEYTFPHSLYLSMLFYSGIIGFVLFVALVSVLVFGVLRLRSRYLGERKVLIALWVNVLVCGLTDLGQVTKGPGPNWYILWLPIAVAIAALAQTTTAHETDARHDG